MFIACYNILKYLLYNYTKNLSQFHLNYNLFLRVLKYRFKLLWTVFKLKNTGELQKSFRYIVSKSQRNAFEIKN